ncbi:hypothetical protein ACE1CI_32370 [Aerosakkonemataceae cyanobacterium BLCC-F50]|uniref:RRM domain-containing protein n=1 Tax=Floridaenema flaviceps BLCC-F50 TaxID=3153642 RepID=A0ABV4Y0Y2_9CYAN
MIKVSGLPVDITESELHKLFENYGTIQSVTIERKSDESVAYVKLDKDENEKLAVEKLNETLFRDQYVLYLDLVRAEKGTGEGQQKGTGNG